MKNLGKTQSISARFGLGLLARVSVFGLCAALMVPDADAATGAKATVVRNAAVTANSFHVINPFALSGVAQNNLTVASVVGAIGDVTAASATGLTVDGVSAGIGLWATATPGDVTFTSNNGVTLLAYDPAYLTKAPTTGATSITVKAASLVKVGALYYAPVLVQSPLGAAPSFTAAVTVTASQGSVSGQSSLKLVPPPVALIHGLWGDAGSLQSTSDYLNATAPWAKNAPVQALCYSKFLTFDAKSDPLTNGTDPCEFTSKSATQTKIASLIATQNANHVVTGRVDVVGHSMGGLVIRNFASQTGYRSTQDRMQGQFHVIVTLDTPETGSTLAPYLINNVNATRQASLFTKAGLVWEGVCGSKSLATCFNDRGMPIAGPGQPVNTGAVFSLVPGATSLANPALSGPNVTGATWRAIGATAPSNSALYFGVGSLIAATYSSPTDPSTPTINSILQNPSNDAIVTIPSQFAGITSSSQGVQYSNLSHTSLPGGFLSILYPLFGFDNDSVTNDTSGLVNAQTGCWLKTAGSTACFVTSAAKRTNGVKKSTTPVVSLDAAKFVDRMTLSANQTMVAGAASEMPVRLANIGQLKQVTVYQENSLGHSEVEVVPVSRVVGDTAYIRVMPQVMGTVKYTVTAAFADGGIASQTTQVAVTAPKAVPTAFKADGLPIMVLSLSADQPMGMLRPQARYDGIKGTMMLDAGAVRYRVVSSSGAAVVGLEPTGLVRALHAGEAVIEARFGNAVDQVRIIVKP